MRNADADDGASEPQGISIEIADDEHIDHIKPRQIPDVHYCEKESGEENPYAGSEIFNGIVLNNTPENKFLCEAGACYHDYDRSKERPEGKVIYQWTGLQNEIFDDPKRYARA